MSHGKVNSVCCQLKNALPFKDYITLAHTFCLLQVKTKTAPFQMLHYSGTNILSITEDKSTILKDWMLQKWFDKTATSAP